MSERGRETQTLCESYELLTYKYCNFKQLYTCKVCALCLVSIVAPASLLVILYISHTGCDLFFLQLVMKLKSGRSTEDIWSSTYSNPNSQSSTVTLRLHQTHFNYITNDSVSIVIWCCCLCCFLLCEFFYSVMFFSRHICRRTASIQKNYWTKELRVPRIKKGRI